jgi:lipopolysaccharide/colanic/teichoic acid biosynthesis glycosyltransferase
MSKDAPAAIATRVRERRYGVSTSETFIPSVHFVEEAPEPHFAYNVSKRLIDIAASAIGLIILAPVFAVVALLNVRGGGVFYRQQRLGLSGREFSCIKFRSMVPGAEEAQDMLMHLNITDGPTYKTPDDPRLTKFGRFLRQTSIDELPQLFNVLRGEMSLVGPRPLAVLENRYTGHQHLRLSVKPGLTCIWQVSGRSKIGFNRWMEMDLEYVGSRSLVYDLKLIFKTIPAVLRREGAF